MELSERKIEDLNKQPLIETKVWKSKDELWIIHETRILDFKPKSFFEKVIKPKEEVEEEILE